jgi:SET domain-containing protein
MFSWQSHCGRSPEMIGSTARRAWRVAALAAAIALAAILMPSGVRKNPRPVLGGAQR